MKLLSTGVRPILAPSLCYDKHLRPTAQEMKFAFEGLRSGKGKHKSAYVIPTCLNACSQNVIFDAVFLLLNLAYHF